MEQNLYERVAEDDPRRCQHVIPTRGQCILVSVEGSKYCVNHGGKAAAKAEGDKVLRNYRIRKYQARIGDLSQSDAIKSLREEVAILRMLIEERINACHDPHDLLLHSGPISDLVMKVDKVVNSCNRLDVQLGKMLDATQAIQFGQEIVEIVAKYIDDEDTLASIADEISDSVGRLAAPKVG